MDPRDFVAPPDAAPHKIVGRNANGTLVVTSGPSNEAELQLYRVMQRASLLAYYDTLLEMGGDDVQQLCDAGEEEFLEIMALVGMAAKPLHVRRLQKALQEWVTNPALFQTPLVPFPVAPPMVALPGGHPPQLPPAGSPAAPKDVPACAPSPGHSQEGALTASPGSPGSPLQLTPVLMETQIARLAEAADMLVRSMPQVEPRPHNSKKRICKDIEYVMNMPEDDPRRMDEIRKYAAIYGRFDCKRKPEKPLTLHEVSVNEAAAQICRFSPAMLTRRDELFPLARQVVRDSGYHYSKGQTSLPTCFRSHLGRTNGEDGQIAKRPRLEGIPSLSPGEFLDNDSQQRLRRQERLEQIAEELRSLGLRTEELVAAAQRVREINDFAALQVLQQQMEAIHSKQSQLLLEQTELMSRNHHRYSRGRSGRMSSGPEGERPDTDDTDSQLSFSNVSSPSQEVGDSRDSIREAEISGMLEIKTERSPTKATKQLSQENAQDDVLRVVKDVVTHHNSDSVSGEDEGKVKVIASSGGNIIAVANPALSMSPAIGAQEVESELTPIIRVPKTEPSANAE